MRLTVNRRIHRGEEGLAFAVVMLIGFVMVMITAVLAGRAARQVGNTVSDVRWGQALYVAESCIDVGLVELQGDRAWSTGDTLDPGVIGTSDERDWALQAADAKSVSEVVETPEGECVTVKPDDAGLLFSVGFTPTRSADDRRVRVLVAKLSPPSGTYTLNFAFLSGDDLQVTGNPTFDGASASAHANDHVDVSGNPTFQYGCLTSSNGGSVSGNLNVHASCPQDPFDEDPVELPDVNPRRFWRLTEYDMCPDGTVRAGPAHPVLGDTTGAEPCSGLVLEPDAGDDAYRGWTFDGCCDEGTWAEWSFSGNSGFDGSYYFLWGTAVVDGSPGTQNDPWEVLITTEARESCEYHEGGDIKLEGNMVIEPYASGEVLDGNQFVVVAGRDLEWSGNGRLGAPGLVAAIEQIEIGGNPQTEGGFVAAEQCDSQHDSIDQSSIDGNATFRLDGPMEADWNVDVAELSILGWYEL